MSIRLQKVLLIDDDCLSNYMHQYLLEDTGMFENVEIAETAMDALDKLERDDSQDVSQPEIIFVDLNMPGLNGWDFIKEYSDYMKNRSAKSLLVILTSSEETDDKLKATYSHDVCAYLTKPLTHDKVMAVVGKYLH